MTRERVLKLIDFEHLAPCPLGTIKCSRGPGTPRYMACEVLSDGSYSTASEVWALGCVLWEIWTADLPRFPLEQQVSSRVLPEDDRRRVKMLVCTHKQRLPLGDVPTGVAELLEQCWAQDPRTRPTAHQVTDLSFPLLLACSLLKRRRYFLFVYLSKYKCTDTQNLGSCVQIFLRLEALLTRHVFDTSEP